MRLDAARPRRWALSRPARRSLCFGGAHAQCPARAPMAGGADEDWIVSGRWSAAFALALLLHLPVLHVAALDWVEQAQWLAGPGRGAGSDVVSVYELYLVTPKASDAETATAAQPVAQAGTAVRAEAPAPTKATAAAAPPPALSEAGGGGHDAYYARLRAHLQRYRRPVHAGAAGARAVVIRFRVDGKGSVSAIGLQRSSGDPLLDAEAVDLLRRSAPVPPPPRGQAMNLAVPIEFE